MSTNPIITTLRLTLGGYRDRSRQLCPTTIATPTGLHHRGEEALEQHPELGSAHIALKVVSAEVTRPDVSPMEDTKLCDSVT